VLLALLFIGVHARGLDWGLPSFTGWIPDELLPGDVVRGLESSFGGGWHERYPPLHYYLLGLIDRVVLWAHGLPAHNPVPAEPYAQMFLLGRVLSLLMGAGSAALVYLCGSRLYGRAAGALAALLWMGMPSLAFHTRLATLDVPYIFWWTLSLLFALRALERRRPADLLAWGLTAALAVTTKDQAYGLYLLAWPALLWPLLRPDSSDPQNPRPALGARELVPPVLLGAAVFALVHRLPGNTSGYLEHVGLMVGSASEPFRAFPRSLAGALGLALETVRQVAVVLGLPAFVLGLAGLVWAGLRRFALPGERFLLASGLSYYLSFIAVVLYSYDRFVLPLCLLLALFGAGALARLAERGRVARRLASVVALGLCALSLGRAAALGSLMANDSRYAAERWLREHVAPGERLGFVGGWKDMPRPDGLRVRSLPADIGLLRAMRPSYVVSNLERAALVKPQDREAPFFDGLTGGRLGYALVWRWRAPVAWPLSAELQALFDCSNLSWVNPGIAIYKRLDQRPALVGPSREPRRGRHVRPAE
jgi:4-amino-4-deoxy-L-arabinose transferase-like glycosyltransferase